MSDPSLRDLEARLAPLSRPALHVVASDVPTRSHLGGDPGLPTGLAWPEREGIPLTFLARLSLAELQAARPLPWLPATGALLFFYDIEDQPWGFDPNDRGGWRVLHVADAEAPIVATSASSPDAAAATIDEDRAIPLPMRPVAFRAIDSLPSEQRDEVVALDLGDDAWEAMQALTAAPFGDAPRHQVDGYPFPLQGDHMALECQLVSHGLYCGDASGYEDPRAQALAAGAAEWRLLFQLDSDDDLEVMWGDCGTLYFWVRETQARAGDFEDVWVVLQCA